MTLQELLDYVKENARDVSDLGEVADIEHIEPGDPYRKTLIRDIRAKYEDEALEAEREEILDGWI